MDRKLPEPVSVTDVSPILARLKEELAAIEAQLAEMSVLNMRAGQLRTAISALEQAVKPPTSVVVRTPGGRPTSVTTIGPAHTISATVLHPPSVTIGAGVPKIIVGGDLTMTGSVTNLVKPPAFADAAELVLRQQKHALHISQIIEGIRARGWYADRDAESIRTSLVPTLNRKVEKGEVFWKEPSKPVYGLLEWRETNGS